MKRPFPEYEKTDSDYSMAVYIETLILNSIWHSRIPFPIKPGSLLNSTDKYVLLLPYGFDAPNL